MITPVPFGIAPQGKLFFKPKMAISSRIAQLVLKSRVPPKIVQGTPRLRPPPGPFQCRPARNRFLRDFVRLHGHELQSGFLAGVEAKCVPDCGAKRHSVPKVHNTSLFYSIAIKRRENKAVPIEMTAWRLFSSGLTGMGW